MADPKERPERQESLPFPPTLSASIAGRTMQESVYKQRVTPRRLPADAPNILIVFIDDAGPPSGDVRQRSANPDESTALSTAARRVSRHNLHGRLGLRGAPTSHPRTCSSRSALAAKS
jgi:hypothetical protein